MKMNLNGLHIGGIYNYLIIVPNRKPFPTVAQSYNHQQSLTGYKKINGFPQNILAGDT